jgi:hypothetical protein
MKEGEKFLRQEGVMEQLMERRVTLALWGLCKVVVDGARMGEGSPDEGYRKGELPPPAEYKDGSSPI